MVLVARRFLIVLPHTGGFRSGRRSSSARTAVAWRLLGGNNRALGRSALQFETGDECEQAISLLRHSRTTQEDSRISFDPGNRGWRWQLLVNRVAVAESSRSYSRQRECRYSLEQFIDKFPHAELSLPRPKGIPGPASHETERAKEYR
jgi:hypothetical protein